MKAGILRRVNELAYADIADPNLQAGDLLIKVKAATVCGTDIRILRGTKTAGIRYPSILGHEFAGVVADAGGQAQFKVGQAVTVCPQFACGECRYCKSDAENLCSNLLAMGYGIDGGFAEYVRVPASAVRLGHVFAMPQHLRFAEAALAEPLACVMNGQERVGVNAGDSVLILGAGPIGLLHVKVAKLAGAGKIIVSAHNAARREAALQAGADVVIDPKTQDLVAGVKSETNGAGVDVAIVAIGVPALANDALKLVRHRGRVSLFAGFPKDVEATLDINAIHYNEITVTGAFGLSRRLFERALHLIGTGQIEVKSLLTHEFELAEIISAFDAAEQGIALKAAVVMP
jgi:L-iditol 2-dehydrogenase